jgi:hypothetical protein
MKNERIVVGRYSARGRVVMAYSKGWISLASPREHVLGVSTGAVTARRCGGVPAKYAAVARAGVCLRVQHHGD